MKAAGTCRFACIIGPEERERNSVAVKDMKDGTQENISLSEAAKYIREKL